VFLTAPWVFSKHRARTLSFDDIMDNFNNRSNGCE
jgi:hypothetical protein